MRKLLLCLALLAYGAYVSGQSVVRGKVFIAESKLPLSEVTLRSLATGQVYRSGDDGGFEVLVNGTDTLTVTHLGYTAESVALNEATGFLSIYMEVGGHTLEAVEVSTGYYQIPKERATGSFVHVDNKLLERVIGGNILQRLEGIAPGVQFVHAGGTEPNSIRVRGVGTIESDDTPLIVLDNFPYEGSLDNIDPNDIESITVLKDGAAASIWGAKAGNGVIVITSKRAARDGKVRISVSANANITDKPDLYYSPEWLPSATVMEIEKERYGLGHYTFADNITIPYYVELLKAYDDGLIDAQAMAAEERILRETDVRAQALAHLYRNRSFQQYALNASGGADRYTYNITAGYHGTAGDIIGNDSRRINLGVRNRFKPYDGMEIGMGVAYLSRNSSNNGIPISGLSALNVGISPYTRLVDEHGNARAVVKDIRYAYAESAVSSGLLDWQYRPVDEIGMSDSRRLSSELRLNGDVSARLWKSLLLKATYQYVRGNDGSRTHHPRDGYYVRNLVNSFTQPNGTSIIPYNGILRQGGQVESGSHQGRLQVNYDGQFGIDHAITALGGVEMRQSISETFPGSILYNYHEEYLTGSNSYNFDQNYDKLPQGRGKIPAGSDLHRIYTNRDLSYFGNASYVYKGKYILSGSMRWDASNLFGVKTNQKGVPLWSIGGSWDLSRSDFYTLGDWLPYLRLRNTYGVAGNINKAVTHFPTIRYGTSPVGLAAATLASVGNPSLRWEQVSTLNVGVDWRLSGEWLSGGVEWYIKKGNDLIGDDYMDPTTGITGSYKVNYASIETKGWDLILNSRNLGGEVVWNTNILMSWVRNKVTGFNTPENIPTYNYFYNSPPAKGISRDMVYAIPWNGLSPVTGLPIIYMDGHLSDEYNHYYNQYLNRSMLVEAGVSIPTHFGSLRNTVSWKGIEVGALLNWKMDYVFRRRSMGSYDEYNQQYHQDYFNRWKAPGDERITDVPAHVSLEDMDNSKGVGAPVYEYSEALIVSGNHIRLQEINLSYGLPQILLDRLPVQNIRFSAYARNLGIIWRANKLRIDPDYLNSPYPAPASYAFGIHVIF